MVMIEIWLPVQARVIFQLSSPFLCQTLEHNHDDNFNMKVIEGRKRHATGVLDSLLILKSEGLKLKMALYTV